MSTLYLHSFQTGWGTFRTAGTTKGLALVALPGESARSFESRARKLFKGHDIQRDGQINRQVEKQIRQYLSGRRKRFDLRLDLRGTPFQKKALKQVARIPYGRTQTYGQIARAIGHSRAFRAVGSANARNPLPLVIPCHRVVASNSLGGYGGGLEMKKKLLAMEGSL